MFVFQGFVNADDFVLHGEREGKYAPFPVAVVTAEEDGTLIFFKKRGENLRVFVNEAALHFDFGQGEAFDGFEKKVAQMEIKLVGNLFEGG